MIKILFIFLSIISLLTLSLCTDTFNYKSGGDDWTGKCKEGQKQSPVNIEVLSTKIIDSTYFYLLNSNENNFTVTNNDNEYTVGSEDLGDVFFYFPDKKSKSNEYSDYTIKKIFIHSPSEHRINNKSYDLEIQILSEFTYGKLNYTNHMLSLLCTVDDESENTDKFFFDILEQKKSLNISSLVFQDQTNSKTFIYEGSLTTPPCTENIIWFVLKTPYKISLKNLKIFREKWENNPIFADGRGNNRNSQQLFNRTIYTNNGENVKFIKK